MLHRNRLRYVSLIFLLIVLLARFGARPVVAFAWQVKGGYSGDGGPAINAQLNSPGGVALDQDGNLYIADSGNHVIRKVSPSGIITTVAGTGTRGHNGDNGPATSAQLSFPGAVCVDRSGNLYITDERVVRKVTPKGIITTVAGNMQLPPGYSGDGGPATSAQFYTPIDVATDQHGVLYILDGWARAVRMVTLEGTITTVAGYNTQGQSSDHGPATSVQLDMPSAIAVSVFGEFYISEANRSVVLMVRTDGAMTISAGTEGTQGYDGDHGFAMVAKLNTPEGLTTDDVGNLYIVDSGNSRIRRKTPGGVITTVAGNAEGYSGDDVPVARARFFGPQRIAVDRAGHLYISEPANNIIRKVTLGGTVTTVAGHYVTGP